jgi:hypothetical protein
VVGSSLLLFSVAVFFLLVFVSKINIMVLFYNKDSCRNRYLLSGHHITNPLAGGPFRPARPALSRLFVVFSESV